MTSSYISSADNTFTTLANIGGFNEDGPVIRVTSAPLMMHSLAKAYPIFPVEWFDINLTGSKASLVGPAVTITFLPFISLFLAISCKAYSKITSGSGNLPSPTSLQAKRPLSGAIIL